MMKSLAAIFITFVGLCSSLSLSRNSRPLASDSTRKASDDSQHIYRNSRPPASDSTRKASDDSQHIYCYVTGNSGGDRIAATDYIDNLGDYNFDNKISSCCLRGIWLLYEDVNYNLNNPAGMVWWAYGNDYCADVSDQFNNTASSSRFSGAPDSWRYDTINMYFDEYFIGEEEFSYNDKPSLNNDNKANSVIVTGCNPWTLYAEENYQGDSICVFPSDSNKCNPGFYASAETMGSLAGKVSSVKKGCYARKRLLPDYRRTRARANQNGTSGFFPIRK